MRTIQYTHEDNNGDEITYDVYYDISPYRKNETSSRKSDGDDVVIREIKLEGQIVEVSEEIMADISQFIRENDEDDLTEDFYFDEET